MDCSILAFGSVPSAYSLDVMMYFCYFCHRCLYIYAMFVNLCLLLTALDFISDVWSRSVLAIPDNSRRTNKFLDSQIGNWDQFVVDRLVYHHTYNTVFCSVTSVLTMNLIFYTKSPSNNVHFISK